MTTQTMKSQGTVYLIHFDEKLCHAGHYLGFTTNLKQRMLCHRKGAGARIIEVINELNIPWRVARTGQAPKSFERELKNYKNAAHLCPICSGEAALNRKKGETNE